MALSHFAALLLLTLAHAQSLTPFESCDALLAFYKKEATSRVGPYGLPGSFVFRKGPVALAEEAAAPEAGTDFSDTNVQVEGVDEPDVIKTDGKRVFVLRGRTLNVVDVVEDGAAGKRSGTLKLPSFVSEMLIEGDDLLIIGNVFRGGLPKPRSIFPGFGERQTVLYRVSVKGVKPVLMETMTIEGGYISAREVDGMARIVTSAMPARLIKFVTPSKEKKISKKEAKRRNKVIIDKSGLDDWLPRFQVVGKGGKSDGFLSPCSMTYKSSGDFAGFSLLTLTTVAIAGPLVPKSVSIAADGEDVYSTAATLYVTTRRYRYDRFRTKFRTELHKFALQKSGPSYVASGVVTGSLLNQFSMHEYKGIFYTATTEGSPWSTRDTSVSKVTAFKTVAGKRKLVQIGSVGNLGVGERIFAVRYIQSTAYVVTFRQIDPLYIIDLDKLKATGELKIPGFSSYLHLVGPGRILGVGGDATQQGRVTGAKVSLFDVSDVTKPTELSAWTLKGAFSSVEWDHRAFLYWAPESVAVLPVTTYGKGGFTGSIVLEISSKEITERGRVEHPKCCGLSSRPSISRNLVLGRTHLWSLSSTLLQVNSIIDLKKEGSVTLKSN